MVRIRSAKPVDGFRVRLDLTDGSTRDVDLEPYLRGPIFEPIRNSISVFRKLQVDSLLGTIVWPNGADIDPDVLIHSLEPAWKERDHVA